MGASDGAYGRAVARGMQLLRGLFDGGSLEDGVGLVLVFGDDEPAALGQAVGYHSVQNFRCPVVDEALDIDSLDLEKLLGEFWVNGRTCGSLFDAAGWEKDKLEACPRSEWSGGQTHR